MRQFGVEPSAGYELYPRPNCKVRPALGLAARAWGRRSRYHFLKSLA